MKSKTMQTLLTILSILIMIFLFVVNKQNNKLYEANSKYKHEIDSLKEQIRKQGKEIYIYETANAMFYEKHRNCGIKLNKILSEVSK